MKHKASKASGHDLALLSSRTLLAILHYVDDRDYEAADGMLGRVFDDYRARKQEVQAAVNMALRFVIKDRYDPAEPPVSKRPRPTKEIMSEVKQRIREVAAKTWKKQKSS